MLEASVDMEEVANWVDKAMNAHDRRMRDAAATGFSVMLQNAPEDRGTANQDAIIPEKRGDRYIYGYGGTAGYMLAQEKGTGPYFPPKRPLIEWGERKFNDAGAGMGAWHKITREGIEGKEFMAESLEAAQGVLEGDDIDEYINEEMGGGL